MYFTFLVFDSESDALDDIRIERPFYVFGVQFGINLHQWVLEAQLVALSHVTSDTREKNNVQSTKYIKMPVTPKMFIPLI